MIDTRLGYTIFPADKRQQSGYWPKIGSLPFTKEEDIQPGSMIYPLRSALLSATVPYVDMVLLTLPEQHLHEYREGKSLLF